LPIPLKNYKKINFDQIDHTLRTKGIYAVLESNDKILLEEGLGYSKE